MAATPALASLDLDALSDAAREAIEALPLRLFIKRRDLTYVLCTAVLAREYGALPSRIRGRTDFDYFSRPLAEAYRADDARVLADGLTRVIDEPFESGGVTRWIRTTKVPVRGAGGEITGLLGVIEDATQENRAIAQRDEALGANAQLWEHSRDGLAIVDATTGEIVDVNPAMRQMAGREAAELVGQPYLVLHPREQWPRVREAFAGEARGPAIVRGLSVLCADGRAVPVDISASQVVTYGGRRVIIGSVHDVSVPEQAREKLERQAWALSAYADASSVLSRARTPGELLQGMCQAIVAHTPYVLAWVGIANPPPECTLTLGAHAGPAVGYLDGLVLGWSEDRPEGRGPTGQCIRTGTSRMMRDSESAPDFALWRERARQFGIRSSVTVPIAAEREIVGALMVYADHVDAFGPGEIVLFERLADSLAHGLRALEHRSALELQSHRREQAQRDLSVALEATIAAIAATMEQRDPYTSGHERRVARLATAIAQELGWEGERLTGLRMAGLVHDIGKIAVPTEILTKPAKLSAVEFDLVREHAEAGYRILKDIPFPWPVAAMVWQHHERFDGSGYPLGLAGEAILPEARVLAVADVVESMSSHRPYRAALGIQAALAEIAAQSGTQFDAAVVEACLRLFREGRFTLDTPPSP